jgi:hypothetical protein
VGQGNPGQCDSAYQKEEEEQEKEGKEERKETNDEIGEASLED